MAERTSLRITLPYFAFLRGLVQGLGARLLWGRYLAHTGDFDVRVCRRLVKQLQRELGAVARRQGRPEVAVVLRQAGVFTLLSETARSGPPGLEPESRRPPLSGAAGAGMPGVQGLGHAEGVEIAREAFSGGAAEDLLPTLDDIRARFDPDVFSESELLEIWREEVQGLRRPAPSPAPDVAPEEGRREGGGQLSGGAPALLAVPSQLAVSRRARRMMQRLEALSWLERLCCEPPQPEDPTDAWLEPLLCERLAVAGVRTLQGLFDLANRLGYNWHSVVPRLGAHGAQSVVGWLRSHESSLGPFPAHALAPQSELDVDVKEAANKGVMLPWEQLGKAAGGVDLLHSCGALADHRRADAWLESLHESPNTHRAYRRETERFFLWCLLVLAKAPGEVGGEVPLAYLSFLARPPPDWCAPRRTPRWSPSWRPLEGPLSGASIRVARQIVSSLLNAIREGAER